MSEFQIGLVARLDSSKSKQQLNSDIEALKKQLTTVEVQAKLGKDVVTNLTQQLNAVQINLNNVKVDQTAINNMISQFNTAFSKVNINLGNINTNGATQSAQKTGQQIGNQLGNSINQSLQANLNHVKQDIQNIFSSFSVQKLNNADIFKNFTLCSFLFILTYVNIIYLLIRYLSIPIYVFTVNCSISFLIQIIVCTYNHHHFFQDLKPLDHTLI